MQINPHKTRLKKLDEMIASLEIAIKQAVQLWGSENVKTKTIQKNLGEILEEKQKVKDLLNTLQP